MARNIEPKVDVLQIHNEYDLIAKCNVEYVLNFEVYIVKVAIL